MENRDEKEGELRQTKQAGASAGEDSQPAEKSKAVDQIEGQSNMSSSEPRPSVP